MVKRIGTLLLIGAFVMLPTTSFADAGSVENELGALQNLVKDLQSHITKLEKRLESVEADKSLQKKVNNLEGQVSAIKAAPVAATAATVPSWLEGTTFGGDVRVRWQTQSNNDMLDTNLLRTRLRYGISKQVNDELFAKFRIGLGTSANDEIQDATYGGGTSTASFPMADIGVDQLYLKYTPNYAEGLSIYGGKFPVNWKIKGWLWDSGVNPNGVGESYEFDITDGVSGYVNLAQLVLTAGDISGNDKDQDSEIYVFQTGVKGGDAITWGSYATAYWFDGYSEAGNVIDSGLQGNPFVIVGTCDVGFSVDEIPVKMYVQGGMNVNAVDATNSDIENLHYALGVTINPLKEQGDLQAKYDMAYLESDVIPTTISNGDINTNMFSEVSLSYRAFKSTDVSLVAQIPHAIDSSDSETETVTMRVQVDTKF